jgi:hypothetical protein
MTWDNIKVSPHIKTRLKEKKKAAHKELGGGKLTWDVFLTTLLDASEDAPDSLDLPEPQVKKAKRKKVVYEYSGLRYDPLSKVDGALEYLTGLEQSKFMWVAERIRAQVRRTLLSPMALI